MEERYYATGRRKTAVARVWITQGNGQVKVNDRAVDEYFGEAVREQALLPLRTLGLEGEFDVWVTVKGGGISGQAGALRHGLARALVVANEDYRKPLRKNGSGVDYLESEGPRLPLGALRDTAYESTAIALERGDVVVLFSDGVPEAQNPSGQLYGYSAPVELLRQMDTRAMTAERIKLALVDHVLAFAGGSRQRDDMTVVVIKAT